MEQVLKVEDLKTSFVTWNGIVKALDGVSFEIGTGECLGMVGETGCGKSVTALSVMNLIPETSGTVVDGEILFEDNDLATNQKEACRIVKKGRGIKLEVKRRKFKKNLKMMNTIRGGPLSMIFQEPMTTLNPVMTINEQIQDVLYAHDLNDLASRVAARKRVTKEQLTQIISRVLDSEDMDYFTKFLKENPELAGLQSQIEFIAGRRDVTSYRKRILINSLYDKDRTVSNPLQKMLQIKVGKVPRVLPKFIREEASAVARELLTKVNISEPEKVINQYPHELSGGMRQRVVIAIGIASNPHLLIADEPTTALDVTTQAQILDIIKDLKLHYSTSILFITHDLGVISDIADRVAVMYAGSIVETSKTTDLFESPKHPYTQGLLMSIPSYNSERVKLAAIPGSVPNLVNPPSGCKFHPRCNRVMDICRTEKPDMINVGDDHSVACWLYKDEKKGGD